MRFKFYFFVYEHFHSGLQKQVKTQPPFSCALHRIYSARHCWLTIIFYIRKALNPIFKRSFLFCAYIQRGYIFLASLVQHEKS